MDREAVVQLLYEILHGVPSLPGTPRRGRHELFDPVVGTTVRQQRAELERRAAAARVCGTCPSRLACLTVTTSATRAVPCERR